jgi:hypothetical protein
MRLEELMCSEDSGPLYKLCLQYYALLEEYKKAGNNPPPKEMALKLKLHDDEYSSLMIWMSEGGFQDIIDAKIEKDLEQGGFSIQGRFDKLTN